MFASATQDIATDGLAVHIVSSADRGPANGIQVGGYYCGQILGGGLVLVLFDRVGWTAALLAMAVLLALPLIPVLRFREPVRVATTTRPGVDFGALGRGSALSGFSAARFGYAGHFVLCSALALVTALVVARRLTIRHASPEIFKGVSRCGAPARRTS